MKKKTILAISDFGSSGISESIRAPLMHWHQEGHLIYHMCLGYNGCSSSISQEIYPWRERLIPIIPRHPEAKFGSSEIRMALELSKAEIVFTSFDLWMVNYLTQPDKYPHLDNETRKILSPQHRKFQHICYFPIDGAVEGKYLPMGMEEMICGTDIPVTYSKFSQELISKNINIDIPMIPISHDPDVFQQRDKIEARKMMNLPLDGFYVGMVATNQYRKHWGEFFEAVVPFAQMYKNVYIVPWTTWDLKIMGGAEIREFIYRSGLQDRVVDPNMLVGKLSDMGMASMYNALDVCVLATNGEGCGLPPLRARACGVPGLVSNHTSNTEFTGHHLERIPVAGYYNDPFGSNLRRYTTNIEVLMDRLNKLYQNEKLRKDVGDAGIRKMREYEKDVVNPLWDNLLEQVG